jgi:hypothetical protein
MTLCDHASHCSGITRMSGRGCLEYTMSSRSGFKQNLQFVQQQSSRSMIPHTHTHTHTHTHARTHTNWVYTYYTTRHTHTHIPGTHKHIHTHTHIHTYIHTHVDKIAYTCRQNHKSSIVHSSFVFRMMCVWCLLHTRMAAPDDHAG